MLTDEQVIQRVRGALESEAAGIHPPTGLPARIRRDLLASPASDSRKRWWKPALRLRLPNLGGVVTALAGLSAVVIAVVAIAVLGHHRSAAGAGARGPVTVAMLQAKLAVLRRPQTPADRLPLDLPRDVARAEHAAIIGKLSRLAAIVHSGSGGEVKVYVIVEKPAAGRLLRAGGVASSAAAWTFRRGNQDIYSTGPGALVAAPGANVAPSRSGAQIVGSPGNVRRAGGVDMGVVPDGVTHVDWIFGDQFAGMSKLIQPSIENNIAAAKVPPHEGYLSSAMWYGASGRLIASFSDDAQVARQDIAQAEASGRRMPIPSSLMRHFAVFRSPPPPPAVRRALPFMLARGAVSNNFFGLNIDQARFVPYPGAPSQPGARPGIWLIPGTGGVSLTDGSAGTGNPFSIVYGEGGLISTISTSSGAATSGGLHTGGQSSATATATAGGLQPGQSPPRTVTVTSGTLHPGGKSTTSTGGQGTETVGGLVENGNATVTVELAGGAVKTVPVVDNVFSITVRGHVVAVIAKNSSGRKVTFH